MTSWILGLLIALLIGIGLPMLAFHRVEYVETTTKDWGEVKHLFKCSSSKYSYYCDVYTTKYTFYRMDITDFPSEGLYPGDKIFLEQRYFSRSRNYFYCKNNLCKSHSSCYKWMPSWSK